MAASPRYVLGEILGRGGFATVYRAWDRELRRDVALKLLRPELSDDDGTRRRFQREAQRLARLDHPCVVPVYDVGEADGRPFFTMRLIPGLRLTDIVLGGSPLPVDRAVHLLREVARAIDYLHAQKVIHLDIKSANVMVEQGDRVTLMDLGISRTTDHTPNTLTGESPGTPYAMAPEQIVRSRVGPAADIYALGVLAFELLCGKPPFSGDLPRLVYAHVHEPPPPPSALQRELPAAIDGPVLAALAKNPGDRPTSASMYVEGIAGAAASREIVRIRKSTTRPDSPGPGLPETAGPVDTEADTPADLVVGALPRKASPASPPRWRRARWLAPGALAAIVLAAGLAWLSGAGIESLEPEPPRQAVAGSEVTPAPPTPVGLFSVSDLVVWDQVLAPGGRTAPFATRGSVVACFVATGSASDVMAVVSRDLFAAPAIGQAADTTIARSEPASVSQGPRCIPARTAAGPIPPGTWMLWLMWEGAVAARQPFVILPEDATPTTPSVTATVPSSTPATPSATVASPPRTSIGVPTRPTQTATVSQATSPATVPPTADPATPTATASPSPTATVATPSPTRPPSTVPVPVRTLVPQ